MTNVDGVEDDADAVEVDGLEVDVVEVDVTEVHGIEVGVTDINHVVVDVNDVRVEVMGRSLSNSSIRVVDIF